MCMITPRVNESVALYSIKQACVRALLLSNPYQGNCLRPDDMLVWCAGGTKITRCEVSLDDGKTWRFAQIQRFAPPNTAGKHWAWVHYSLSVPVGECCI
jgi:Mo-co oxidoreductase dimerisation domain